MPAHDQPSSAAISPRSCPTVVGGRPLCACGAKLYRNRKRCVSCALGWTEFAPESHAERLQRIRADRLARQQAEDAKRIEALRAARAERQERAQLLAKIARDDAHRESMPARLAAIRAAATARQRAAKGL